jgi:uncharacterized membrane protein YkgB
LFGENKLKKFAVALGGFLLLVGIVVMGVFVASFLGFVDFLVIENENFQTLSLLLLMAVGLVDLLAGIILWRR